MYNCFIGIIHTNLILYFCNVHLMKDSDIPPYNPNEKTLIDDKQSDIGMQYEYTVGYIEIIYTG